MAGVTMQSRGSGHLTSTVTRSRLKVLLMVVRWALNIAALVCIGLYFFEHRAVISQAAAAFETPAILAAMTTILVGLLPGAWAWQRLCARRLPGVTTLHGILVYLRSAIGKYTPGGILTFVIQQRLLSGQGSRPAMLIQTFMATALAACLSAGLLGLPAALAVGESWIDKRWIVAVALLAVLLLALGYRARHRPVLARLWTKMELPPSRALAQATLLLAGATALTGMHLAVLGAHTGSGTLFLVSAYALSTIFGLVFAVLPGAVGVRDGALLLILATRLEPADAATLALLSRALIVAGDVIGAALSALIGRLAMPMPYLERSTS